MAERQAPDWRGPTEVARNVWREAVTDRTFLAAGGLAFFTMFALLPAIAAAAAVYGMLIPAETLERQIQSLRDVLPEHVGGMLREFMTAIPSGLGFGIALAFHLLIILWTVQRSASGIITALNIVHDIEEKRGRLRREGAALAIAAGSLLFLFLALFLIAALPLIAPAIDETLAGTLTVARWPLLAALFLLYLTAVYRIAPARRTRFSWISIGAGVALLLWLAASALFSLYVSTIGGFDPYYGSATGAVVLMSWLFISSWVVMVGAEVNQQMLESREGTEKEGVKERVDRA